jgi:GPH family glycoside/pentoside/hexuronide:cation symporter
MNTRSSAKRLSFSEKFCFGVGDLANGVAVASTAFWLLYYLTTVCGVSPALAGLALMIGRIWDAVIDPVMGWITDNTRTRWGKCRPYLLFGSLFYGLTFSFLWFVPELDSEFQRFLYITVALLLFNTALTVVFIPYTSLTAGLTQDYNERASLTGFRIAFGQLGFLLGALVPPQCVRWITSPDGAAWLASFGVTMDPTAAERFGYGIFGVVIGLVIIAAVLVTFFGTVERTEGEQQKTPPPWEYLKQLIGLFQTVQSFRIALYMKMISTCAITVVVAQLPFYVEYVLDMKGEESWIFATLLVTAVLSTPLWVYLSKRFGKIPAFRLAMGGYVVVLLGLFLVPAGPTDLVYLIVVGAGFFHSAAHMIPWATMPDVVEDDECQNGVRREGLLYGGTAFAYKFASGFAIFLSGQVLSLSGFQEGASVQPASAVLGMEIAVALIPAVLFLVSGRVAARFPLTAERHRQILAALAERKLQRELKGS